MSEATRYRDAIINNLERGQIRRTRSTDQSKRVQRDQYYFTQGVNLGAQLAKARIHNSTAGLTYDDAPSVEGDGMGSAGDSVVDAVDRTDLRSSYHGDPYKGEGPENEPFSA